MMTADRQPFCSPECKANNGWLTTASPAEEVNRARTMEARRDR